MWKFSILFSMVFFISCGSGEQQAGNETAGVGNSHEKVDESQEVTVSGFLKHGTKIRVRFPSGAEKEYFDASDVRDRLKSDLITYLLPDETARRVADKKLVVYPDIARQSFSSGFKVYLHIEENLDPILFSRNHPAPSRIVRGEGNIVFSLNRHQHDRYHVYFVRQLLFAFFDGEERIYNGCLYFFSSTKAERKNDYKFGGIDEYNIKLDECINRSSVFYTDSASERLTNKGDLTLIIDYKQSEIFYPGVATANDIVDFVIQLESFYKIFPPKKANATLSFNEAYFSPKSFNPFFFESLGTDAGYLDYSHGPREQTKIGSASFSGVPSGRYFYRQSIRLSSEPCVYLESTSVVGTVEPEGAGKVSIPIREIQYELVYFSEQCTYEHLNVHYRKTEFDL